MQPGISPGAAQWSLDAVLSALRLPEMELFETYKALWKRAQDDGAFVHYYTWVSFDEPNVNHDPLGATGWFDANTDIAGATPIVRIYRLHCDDDASTPSAARGPTGAHLPPPDLHEELITLAHEYGHLRSYVGETDRADWELQHRAALRRSEIMKRVAHDTRELGGEEIGNRTRAALREELSDDDRVRLVGEEKLAWDIGRALLRELGFTDFSRFDARQEQGLHAHRYRLGLEDARPSDLEQAPSIE